MSVYSTSCPPDTVDADEVFASVGLGSTTPMLATAVPWLTGVPSASSALRNVAVFGMDPPLMLAAWSATRVGRVTVNTASVSVSFVHAVGKRRVPSAQSRNSTASAAHPVATVIPPGAVDRVGSPAWTSRAPSGSPSSRVPWKTLVWAGMVTEYA